MSGGAPEGSGPPRASRELVALSTLILWGRINDTHQGVTRRLVEALEEYASADEKANPRRAHLFRAVIEAMCNCSGARCRRRWCPRCLARKARQDRRKLEERLAALPRGTPLFLVTLTVGSDSLAQGWRILRGCLTRLHRLRFWRRAVVGGAQYIQFVPAKGKGRRWNVHAHLIIETPTKEGLDGDELAACWAGLLAQHGLPGSTDVRRIRSLWRKDE